MTDSLLKPLPPEFDFETVSILRELAKARASLGELKGTVKSLPNPQILIESLILQEALVSSEIENIVTTQDEAFRANISSERVSPEAKEVKRYSVAMLRGYEIWRREGLIREHMLIEMFNLLKQHDGGYRQQAGIVLRNEQTGEIVYEPPQDPRDIITAMCALERFINDDPPCDLDPLIKMALIHHQFESIHPFPDGNGRIGRMLNVLYLAHAGLLDVPVLYLSRPINRTKAEYYRLLQRVRDEGDWEQWVIYMLRSVSASAVSTLKLVSDIHTLMLEVKHRMRRELPKIYSQDLLNNLFRLPYTRFQLLEKEIGCKRQTARRYLKLLAEREYVSEVKQGRNKYYVNEQLVQLFVHMHNGSGDA